SLGMALSGGSSIPTRIFPSETSGSYSAERRPRRAVTTSVATVATIAPSIVSSKKMIRLGHHAKLGSPPTSICQDISVTHVRPSAVAIPTTAPPHAIHHIQVAL